ncbi:MAG TPA: TlpA disulfide reductase family protein [Acidobacteriaceae bacterium]|jgi:peroxiredoxin|nr:TlpA disulfide reductase family protein [Acidobacteriaceae bacterium]
MAPDFSVTNDGKTVSLSQFRGRVVLLNFWASWCPPCIDELPSLLALHQRLPQLVILGVSIDQDAAAYHDFLLQNHIDFLTIREPSQNTEHMYGTVQIPETYVIDRTGHIRRKFVSAQDWTNPDIVRYLASISAER